MNSIVRLIGLLTLLTASSAGASPSTLTYQGRIMKSDGTPLEFHNVSFIVKVTDPAGSCVIYQEQLDGYDMTNSNGIFDVAIGTGSVTWPADGSLTILDAFNNSKTYTCNGSSSTYTAGSDDTRKLRVQFFDGIGWRTISPDSVVRSVPFAGYAMSAQKLGTNSATDFILKTGIPSCATGTYLNWNGTQFNCATLPSSGSGTVTAVSGTAPIAVNNGTTTPQITIAKASASVDGYLSSSDWSTFNSKQPAGTYLTPSDVGTTANKVVSLDSAGKLPSVDGSALTNLNFSSISGVLPVSKGGSGVSSLAANALLMTNGTGTAFTAFSCSMGQTITFDASGIAGCASSSTSGMFANGGNSFGSSATLGTNDSNSLSFKTANSTRMTIASDGKVGLGTSTPAQVLEVASSSTVPLITSTGTYGGNYVGGGFLAQGLSRANGYFAFDSTVNEWFSGIPYGGSGYAINFKSTASHSNATSDITGIGGAANYFYIDTSGKVGIGTTSPSQKLSVAGIIESTSGGIKFPDGTTQTTASVAGAGSWTTNGSTIYNANSGYVGVGNSAPAAPLDVYGVQSAPVTSGTETPVLRVRANGSNWAALDFGIDTSNNAWLQSLDYGGTTTKHALLLNPTGGNVGIGTSTPNATLEVAGQIKISGGTPGAGRVLTSDSSGLATWQAPTGISGGTVNYIPKYSSASTVTPSQIIDTGSTVGIGLTPDAYNLASAGLRTANIQMGNTSGYSNQDYYLTAGANTTTVAVASTFPYALIASTAYQNFNIVGIGGSADANGSIAAAQRIQFFTNPTFNSTTYLERMRIDQNGNVGIGTNNPSYTLHVVGTAGLSSGTAWTNASDIRLKDIHGDYEYGLAEILKLHTVRYSYKKDNALKLPSDFEKTGFIAQEVQKVIPEAVKARPDGYLELNVDPIHWAVVNAIQDLFHKHVEPMKQDDAVVRREVASLKEENRRLKKQMESQQKELDAIKRKLGL